MKTSPMDFSGFKMFGFGWEFGLRWESGFGWELLDYGGGYRLCGCFLGLVGAFLFAGDFCRLSLV